MYRTTINKLAFTFLLVFSASFVVAQNAKQPPAPLADTTKKAPAKPTDKPWPKPFRDFITDKATSKQGLFSVYKQDDKYYFEIPDSLIGRLFMAITRISKSPTDFGYGGVEANRQVLQWEKGPENKLFLRCLGIINMSSDSTESIFQAIQNSNVEPIAGAFEIKAFKKDTSTVIEVTDFFKGDNQVVSLSPGTKQVFRLGSLQADRSYIQSIKTYQINTEVKSVKTFSVSPAPPTPGATGNTLPGATNTGVVTMELNTSMILLPAEPMRRRLNDFRVGYFPNSYNTYSDHSQRVETETFIQRFRLEAKNAEDLAKSKRGELIEPLKQIVYYIDPATPKQWRKYFIQGVNDWNRCFEKAGWKNAIAGKEWPENDSTMSLDDARFNVIRYFASNVENAQGPRVSDPRSGEIIESHIYWYHNVLNIFKQLYAVQVGHLDPRAQQPDFDEELVGRIIRYVCSHELGHTLGLLHNHGSSSTIPVENYRDKNFQKKYGLTPSIMEYARLNYIAQPEDGIALEDLWSKIGVYDDWAITYGYKLIPDKKDEYEEKKVLNQWLKASESDPMLRFGIEQHPYDPRGNSEDLGDNPMKANEYGIKTLKKILPLQFQWTKKEGAFNELLSERYGWILIQLNWYYGHVIKYIGGIYDTPKNTDSEGAVYEPVSKHLQKEAVDFLLRNLFETPEWLLNKNIISRMRPDFGVNRIREMQEGQLGSIFAFSRMQRLIENNASDKNNYSLNELFEDMQKGIWKELDTKKPIDAFRRNLQKVYIERMEEILAQKTPVPAPGGFSGVISATPTNPLKSDIDSEVKASLRSIHAKIKTAIAVTTDKPTKNHLLDVADRIKSLLDPK